MLRATRCVRVDDHEEACVLVLRLSAGALARDLAWAAVPKCAADTGSPAWRDRVVSEVQLRLPGTGH